MLRFGKHQRTLSAPLILGLFFALATPARANIRFYSIVQQVCSSYRVPTSMNDMSLEELGTDEAAFQLTLQSRRNNFEEVMLVGYIAASQAVARTDVEVENIHVIVTIPKADNMVLMTTASIELVEQLRSGKIKSSEFMRQLQWN